MKGATTQYGFEWGPIEVTRGFYDEQKETATLIIRTKKHPHGLQVYVTKIRKIRVFSEDKEWTVQK